MKEETEVVVETLKTDKVIIQDIILLASLVRTLTDLFGSASDLYRKLKRRTYGNDDDVRDPKYPDHWRHLGRRHSSAGHERSRHRHVSWKDLKKDESCDSDEELICTASEQIRAEYDRGYRRFGESYARGDLTTQMQLQMQIIRLQQVQLSINQDLLLSTYLSPSSCHSHLLRLIQTTRTTRSASLQALVMQYDRMVPPPAPKIPEPRPEVPGAFPLPAHGGCGEHRPPKERPSLGESSSSSSSDNSPSSSSDSEDIKPQPEPLPPPFVSKLFCVYSRDLQRDPNLPVTDNFKRGGNHKCPYCHSHIAIKPGKAWEIVMGGGKKFDDLTNILSRTFLVKNRFVIKSHRPNGGFACILCARFRPSDTVAREVPALMEHLWRDHTAEELGKDEDIVES